MIRYDYRLFFWPTHGCIPFRIYRFTFFQRYCCRIPSFPEKTRSASSEHNFCFVLKHSYRRQLFLFYFLGIDLLFGTSFNLDFFRSIIEFVNRFNALIDSIIFMGFCQIMWDTTFFCSCNVLCMQMEPEPNYCLNFIMSHGDLGLSYFLSRSMFSETTTDFGSLHRVHPEGRDLNHQKLLL